MTINTQKLRDLASDLETYNVMSRYPQGLLDAADALDAQSAEIAGLKSQVEMLEACAAGDAALTAGQQREIARLREAAKMLADWAEHEVGAEPDLTPGLAEARAALAQGQGGSDGNSRVFGTP